MTEQTVRLFGGTRRTPVVTEQARNQKHANTKLTSVSNTEQQ